MSSPVGPLILVAARARRRPSRWLAPLAGLALASAFACAVVAEGTITGDRSARAVLASLPARQRAVTLTWQGPVTGPTDVRARELLDGLGLDEQSRVTLLNPVRLSGVVVRLAGISPLSRWVTAPGTPGSSAGGGGSGLGSCRARDCPTLLVSGRPNTARLTAAGVHIVVAGRATLNSAAPLGFTPADTPGPPVLVSGDPSGLGALSGLAGVYRTRSWVGLLALGSLHSWNLAATQQRLQRAQAALATSGSQFSLNAPFRALQSAHSRAQAAPRRLALTGGGALAALAVFVILAAYGLRRDQREELIRLRAAGARTGQLLMFTLAEAGWLSALGLLAGVVLGFGVAALLAAGTGSVGGVLTHSVITLSGLLVLAGGWAAATLLIGCVLLAPGGGIADVLGIAAAAAIALVLIDGTGSGGSLALLLAPLACVASGALVYRLAGVVLRAGERVSRRGPVAVRLALVGLARAPTAPALAVAFVAVSIGLAGFALGYRATLRRSVADQAAAAVPLDARITPSASFITPLQLAPAARWRSLAAGDAVLAVRRTEASYADGSETVTVPALGVAADGLPLIHDWAAVGASAPASQLARRLAPPGAVRTPGPKLPAGTSRLAVAMSASGAVQVTADLRSPNDSITQVRLGVASARVRTARVSLPPGRHELEAIELDEPAGEAATSGHQNAENPAAATQSGSQVTLGPVTAGRRLSLRGWRGVGAAGSAGAAATAGAAGSAPGSVRVKFAETGQPGIVRPPQPSDSRPLPVLVDPGTAAAATATGDLSLAVDGLPVTARIAGVLRRFPTISAQQAGFVVADEAALSRALDASLPGQGRPDELWIATPTPARLHAALSRAPLGRLSASFRVDRQRSLSSEPTADGVLRTLLAAAAVTVALAVIGLLVALLGAMRDPRSERDLEIQGLGPRQLSNELSLRVLAAGTLGTVAGLAVAVAVTRLAVATVQAAGAVAVPDPPVVAVAPVGQLALLGAGAIAVCASAGWLAARVAVGHRRAR